MFHLGINQGFASRSARTARAVELAPDQRTNGGDSGKNSRQQVGWRNLGLDHGILFCSDAFIMAWVDRPCGKLGFFLTGGSRMEKAIGFYWTLPVPWAGFNKLSTQVDDAAAQSRTIRYQRDLIRRHAKTNSLELVHEAVFLEIFPDRGSETVSEALKTISALAGVNQAIVLLVDFSAAQNWRSHQSLQNHARHFGLTLEMVYPEEVIIDGKPFDPASHFEDWRQRQADWSAGKPARLANALARAKLLRATGASFSTTAATLNAEGLPSPTGKLWTADNLRKALVT
jgi:hypothetical protein